MFVCEYCGKEFSCKWRLKTHFKKFHPDIPSECNKKKFQCSGNGCQKTFNNKQSLRRHERFIHNIQTRQANQSVHNCSMCTYETIVKEDMLTHLESDHQLVITPQFILFDSEERFLEWRKKTEISTHTQFIATGGKHKDRLTKSQTLLCHRANRKYYPKSERRRRIMSKGSCKINAFCPAYIKYKEENGIFSVQYVDVHTHEKDLDYIQLSYSERCMMARKIAEGVPFTKILNDNRESFYKGDQLKRVHLTTRKDLHNIKQSFKLTGKESHECQKNNALNVNLEPGTLEKQNLETEVIEWYNNDADSVNLKPVIVEWCKNDAVSVNLSPVIVERYDDNPVTVILDPVIKSESTDEKNVLNIEQEKSDIISILHNMIDDVDEPNALEFVKKKLIETSKTLNMLKRTHIKKKCLKSKTIGEQNCLDNKRKKCQKELNSTKKRSIEVEIMKPVGDHTYLYQV